MSTYTAWAQDAKIGNSKDAKPTSNPKGQIQIPERPSTPLFQGEQGRQKTEIRFDFSTGTVTMKLLVQDPNGYFIPNIRRDNFAVYEDGVRQKNATVEIEHAPVSLAVLMEWGGRYQALNRTLAEEVPRAARQLLDEIGRQDKIAFWRYGDRVEQLADFSKSHETLDELFLAPQAPEFSEVNFYDALISTLQSIKPISGRKALILILSGVDTFSKAKYEDALQAARDCGTPIYAIDVGPTLRQVMERSTLTGPYARIDWNRAESELQEIAKESGGRLYSPGSTFDLSGIYDDMMENLRVRYVIVYKSSNSGDRGKARSVRVELVNPKTGEPVETIDSNGKPIRTKVSVEGSYLPQGEPLGGVIGTHNRD